MEQVHGTGTKLAERECAPFEKVSKCKIHFQNVERNHYEVVGQEVHVEVFYKGEKRIMKCDLEDWERLKDYRWCVSKTGYAFSNITIEKQHHTIKFHTTIMGQRKGFIIDHINRDCLDNRKSNLRFISPLGNLLNKGIPSNNRSGCKGVSYRKDSNKWRAQIMLHGKIYCLGSFERFEDAVNARKIAEEKYFNPILE